MKNIDVLKQKGTTIMFLKTEKYPLSKENENLWTDISYNTALVRRTRINAREAKRS